MLKVVSTLVALVMFASFSGTFVGSILELLPEKAEWTVLFYMCGSNLETEYGFATENLTDISRCFGRDAFEGIPLEEDDWLTKLVSILSDDKVNVVVETGGCKQWHAQALGMDISAESLQRWYYESNTDGISQGQFKLKQTLASCSMANPDTLSNFIRWGAKNYPANKYALVLWDHGGGSKTGLFIDELYSGDIMHLDELGQALRDGGVHFETVLFDACMMANFETAYAIHDSANWMVASEELVAGKGTAVDAWLQQLFLMPHCDGERLGRWICDMTQIKYANEDNESARQLMTWSVIDLSKIERLAFYVDRLFSGLCLAYKRSPEALVKFAKSTFQTERYGTGLENMMDLSGVFYNSSSNTALGLEGRWKMIEGLMDAVVYSVRGAGRPAARGLSFCYATDFSPKELDVYARNCPCPSYLALLDAISPWTAPAWVYKKVRRLPEMNTIDAYKLKATHVILENGSPAFCLESGNDLNLATVRFTLYRRNEATGQIINLGTAPAYLDTEIDSRGIYHMPGLGTWPSIDGDICEMEALSTPYNGDYNTLFNIPIQIDSDVWNLRCGYMVSDNTFTVYGLWDGFDSDSTMFNRNVRALAQMAGREYCLLYKIDDNGRNAHTAYEMGAPKTLYRKLMVESAPLPAGTYFVEYTIYDVFMRPMKLQRVELQWDGQKMTAQNDTWKGTETLSVTDYYEPKQ